MELLTWTTEQTPATNRFHTSKVRKKGMTGAGQAKQTLENFSLLDGMFRSWYYFHILASLMLS